MKEKYLKAKKAGKRMVKEFCKAKGLRPTKVSIPVYRGCDGYYTTPYLSAGGYGYYLNHSSYGTDIFDRFGRIKRA